MFSGLKKIYRSKGVESIDVEQGKIAVAFDQERITKEELDRIIKDSIEKLGYKIED